MFCGLIKEWDQATQRKPREGETAEQVAQEAERERRDNEDEGILEIGLEMVEEVDEEQDIADHHPVMVNPEDVRLLQEIIARGNRGNDILGPVPDPQLHQQPRAEGPERVDQLRPVMRENDQPQPALGGQQLVPNQPQANQPRPNQPQGDDDALWEFHQNINLRTLATAVMGALFFPAASSVMGEVLKYSLPRNWVMRPTLGVKTLPAVGLLQEKWGRSMVGGALFIVLKDAVLLYCKWRKAKSQGMRRVVDFAGKRKGRP